MSSFKKIGEKGRTGSGSEGGGREMERAGDGGRNGPNNVCTYEYMKKRNGNDINTHY
jgi:hypothetical protein